MHLLGYEQHAACPKERHTVQLNPESRQRLVLFQMQMDEQKSIESYIPRKCSATGRLIPAKEYGSIQLNIGEVDAKGHYNGKFTSLAISGAVRRRGESDTNINRLCHAKGILTFST